MLYYRENEDGFYNHGYRIFELRGSLEVPFADAFTEHTAKKIVEAVNNMRHLEKIIHGEYDGNL